MHSVIVGLEYYGPQFYNEVVRYCQITNQPNSTETYAQIYKEVLSQVVSKITSDPNEFLTNLMELPAWQTINYTPAHPSEVYNVEFKNAVRAFALCLWNSMKNTLVLHDNAFYRCESCTSTLIIMSIYINAEYV